jgi:hypothetical protein
MYSSNVEALWGIATQSRGDLQLGSSWTSVLVVEEGDGRIG